MTRGLDDVTDAVLVDAVRRFGTPSYLYWADRLHRQFDALADAFGGRFSISYAVKANPNRAVLEQVADRVTTLDVSSGGELARALGAGFSADRLTFSSPGKRAEELRAAVEAGCGEMVCESVQELSALDALAREAGRRMKVFPRINPSDMPAHFGVNMAGRPSQFGIDEEDVDAVLARLPEWKNLDVEGFHIYSGTNSLSEEAIAENFGIFIRIFERCAALADVEPRKLIFGSGFGIPYTAEERPLDLDRLAQLVNPRIDALRADRRLGGAECVLEMGRFLIGPAGYYLTSVIREKRSRGAEIRVCDGGMNHHLAACGMLGAVIRRNWPMWKIGASDGDRPGDYTLVGPLCTSIDTLAQRVTLPRLSCGDTIAIGSSGAYGLSSSPIGFISHPPPRELMATGSGGAIEIVDVSE